MLKQKYRSWIRAGGRCCRAFVRAYSGIMFGQSIPAGLLIFGAAAFDVVAGAAGVAAVLAALVTTLSLGYRRDLADQGFYGYNALLCGLALGHGQPLTVALIAKAAILGVMAALLTAVLSEWFDRIWRLPILALPFVLATSLFWRTVGLSRGTTLLNVAIVPDLPIQFPRLLADILRAFGAIVFNPTTAAGLLVFLAVVATSRILAAFAVVGAMAATLIGLFTPGYVDSTWVLSARYNGLLVCAALGTVFFVPSVASAAWAVIGALLAAGLTLALGPIFTGWGIPLLAWPFVVVALIILRGLALRRPGWAPHAPVLPHANAEVNLAYNRMLRSRFGLPGPTRLSLPVEGTWTITQGFDGLHTHQEPWQHALDFEITDNEGFPFCGRGLAVTDYHCFDAPVHAVLPGTVVFVYSEHSDNPPGTQDLNYPFGNVVIVQHGITLFSVLAHLRQSSVVVNVGQVVSAGTLLARCGSSGRSPRPHLHLQIQSSGYIGVPTLPFQLLHFAMLSDGAPTYVPFGLPGEGDRVASAQLALASELPILRVGAEITLSAGGRLRMIRSEISPLGFRSLFDSASGDRLYFSDLDGVAAFTSYEGRSRSPLSVLALALPRVPPFGGETVMNEQILPSWLFPPWLQRIQAVAGAVGFGVAISSQTRVLRMPSKLTAHTSLEVRWGAHVWSRYEAGVEVEGDTITSLSLSRGRRTIAKATRAVALDSRTFEPGLRRPVSTDRLLAYLTIPVVAGVAMASALLSSTPSVARSAPAPLEESYRLETAGDLTQAIDAAAMAANDLPRSYFPRLRLAHLEAQARRYTASATDYEEAAKLAPEAVEPLLGQLLSLVAAERFQQSVVVAEAILQIDPKNYTAHSRRAWALYQLGRYPSAVGEYTTVIDLYPGDMEMRLGRAYSLAGAKRPVEAGIEFREVLKRSPRNRQARTALGLP